MTFEFLIACNAGPEGSVEGVREVLVELFTKALGDTGAEFDPSMLQISHIRLVDGAMGDNGNALVGFAIELPGNEEDEDTTAAKTALDGFTAGLRDSPQVFHALCFEDPLLRVELARYAVEIFALEMKLRRALSFIYLNAYQLSEPFSLIRAERVRIHQGERLPDSQMEEFGENQFFRLDFRDYIGLNQRQVSNVADILSIIRSADDFDAFREQMLYGPVSQPGDVDFIANLKDIMDPVEKMRNCVAHNRHPTSDVIGDYPDARDRMNDLLNDYLSRWEVQE